MKSEAEIRGRLARYLNYVEETAIVDGFGKGMMRERIEELRWILED